MGGVFAGDWLKERRQPHIARGWLWAAGAAAMVVGLRGAASSRSTRTCGPVRSRCSAPASRRRRWRSVTGWSTCADGAAGRGRSWHSAAIRWPRISSRSGSTAVLTRGASPARLAEGVALSRRVRVVAAAVLRREAASLGYAIAYVALVGRRSSAGCTGAAFSSASEGIIAHGQEFFRAFCGFRVARCGRRVVLVLDRDAAGRPITVTDLLSLQRVSDPQVSPDGARVLYTVGVPDVPGNRTARDIWLVTVATGEAKALTSSGRDSDGRWSPDGSRVAFISSRAGTRTAVRDERRRVRRKGRVGAVGRCGEHRVVAGWPLDRLHVRGLSGLQGRRLQRSQRQGTRREQSRRRASTIGCSIATGRPGAKASAATCSSSQLNGGAPRDLTARRRLRRAAARARGPASRSRSRPTAARLPSSPSPMPWKRPARTAISSRCPSRAARARKLTTNPGFDGAPAYSPDGKCDRLPLAAAQRLRVGQVAADGAGPRVGPVDEPHRRLGSQRREHRRGRPTGATIYFNAEDRGAMPVFAIAATGGQPRAAHGRCVRRRVQPRRTATRWSCRGAVWRRLPSCSRCPASGTARPLTHQNSEAARGARPVRSRRASRFMAPVTRKSRAI